MASLLSKFRIDYATLTMIEDITATPHQDTQAFFNNVISQFKNREESNENSGTFTFSCNKNLLNKIWEKV